MRPGCPVLLRRIVPWLIAGALAAASTVVAAQDARDYPSRPIHLIVPSAPAGAGDALAREVAARLSQALDVPVVVDNRPGASGIVGTEVAARATPDGYTLLLATSATHVIAAEVAGTTRYDPVADFDPVIDLVYAMSVIVVDRKTPVVTLPELVRYARAHPGQLAYASSGAGSANHLDMEVFSALTGTTLLHVPYRGTAEGYRGLLAGEVQVMVGAITSALPHIEAGRVRPLAVMAQRRSALLPGVPTLAEAGVGDADVRKWLGLMAPAGTPRPVIERLNATLGRILQSPGMTAWMQAQGFEAAGGTPQDYRATVVQDTRKWKSVVERVVRNAN